MAVSDIDTVTDTTWLSDDQLELVRAHVPVVYVEAVPVRVDALGNVTRSACCCGWPPTARSAG